MVNLHSKFKVCSMNRSGDMDGSKILKAGQVVNRGSLVTPYLIPRPRFAYLLHNSHGATMMIKGSLQVSIVIVKAFFSRF